MKLVVGLGNPGTKYVGTRHNVGFDVIGELARRWFVEARSKFQGECFESRQAGERILLLRPQTYMNRSGASVLAARDFFKIENQDLLIVCDDFNLALGRIRLRPKGSSGGQKGLDDIIRRLGTDQVPRMRIGIGIPPSGWAAADYVLSRFRDDERDEVVGTVNRAADAVVCWLHEGLEAGMNLYNGTE